MSVLLPILIFAGLVYLASALSGLWLAHKVFHVTGIQRWRLWLSAVALLLVPPAAAAVAVMAPRPQSVEMLIVVTTGGAILVSWLLIIALMRTSGREAALAIALTVAVWLWITQVAGLGLRFTVMEAFSVPTGAMAPTIIGRHKNIVCTKCKHPYNVSASMEIDYDREANYVVDATCPVCRLRTSTDPETENGAKYPSVSGDRIICWKRLRDPQRWDLLVFRYPEDPRVNYIKRLVGLPGETIKIARGDLWARGTGETTFRILRKPTGKLRDFLHLVHDSNYIPDPKTTSGLPARWQAGPISGGGPAPWKSQDGGRSFNLQAPTEAASWLRYQHFVPLARAGGCARAGD